MGELIKYETQYYNCEYLGHNDYLKKTDKDCTYFTNCIKKIKEDLLLPFLLSKQTKKLL